jgi:hypothetical protein
MCVLLSSLKIGPVLTKPDLTRWQLFETHWIMRFAFLVSCHVTVLSQVMKPIAWNLFLHCERPKELYTKVQTLWHRLCLCFVHRRIFTMKYDVSEGGSASVFRKRSTYTGEPLRQSCSQLLSPSNLQHLHLRDPPGWYFLHLKMEAQPPSEKSYFTVKKIRCRRSK